LLWADVLGTCLAVSLLAIHNGRRLYQSMYVSIFSRHRTAGIISLLNGWFFHIATGLSLIAESPSFVKQDFGESVDPCSTACCCQSISADEAF
jgi:hypothetical protein